MIEMHARLPQLMQRLAFGITQAFTEALSVILLDFTLWCKRGKRWCIRQSCRGPNELLSPIMAAQFFRPFCL